ncbi:hypothetical protein ACFWWT_39550 [Streptomyces sp. NPDC058676]|uniref:hypothetical protein n=1 Tax=unclassified Streptomyces TaxID=2593676 RepID=UPI0036616A93
MAINDIDYLDLDYQFGVPFTASISYPFPDPKSAPEREVNLRAADNYRHQEEEAADFLGEGAGMPPNRHGRSGPG